MPSLPRARSPTGSPASLCSDVAHRVAIKATGSHRREACGGGYAHGGAAGGGIFALRRPRPYSRHCGETIAGYAAPTIICAYAGINGNGEQGDNDAAHRIAIMRPQTAATTHVSTPFHPSVGAARKLPAHSCPFTISHPSPMPHSLLTNSLPSSYHRRTSSSASSDFTTKSEHEATKVRRWYEEGTALMQPRAPSHKNTLKHSPLTLPKNCMLLE